MTTLLTSILGTVLVSAYGVITGLFFMGFDRILAARMQARIGPPLTQPFLDFFKLMAKETIVPDEASPRIFNAAPVIALASSIALLLYLPIGSWSPVLAAQGDLILILYLLIIPALAMVAGGFASASPYATIGAQREMVTMISYELPLATTAIGIAWKMNDAGLAAPFSIVTITANPIWSLVGPVGFVGVLLLLAALVLVTPGELSRIPFDTPEAETELAGGIMVEYSGRNLALFNLSLAVKTIVMASLIIALFFPYHISGLLGLGGLPGKLADFLFFILKLEVVVFFSTTLIRVAMARFQIDRVVKVYWRYIGVMGLIGMALLMIDAKIN
jgi:formate hydrogenlyase subunit 4